MRNDARSAVQKLSSVATGREYLLTKAYDRFGRHVVEAIGKHLPWEDIGYVAAERFTCPGGLVYFIGGDSGAIKIGFTTQPIVRLGSLQLGSPIPLRFMAAVQGPKAVEKEYHQRFAAHRLHGEWFARAPEIEAEIAHLTTPSTTLMEGAV